jgi:hypothetical protein
MFEIFGLFFSINKSKRGQPIVCFIGPLKYLGNNMNHPKIFCPFIFYEYI